MIIIYWGYRLFVLKSKAERSFGQVVSLLDVRLNLVEELLKITIEEEEIKSNFSEIRELLIGIKGLKKDIHGRFLKEHVLSEKLELLRYLAEKYNALSKIFQVTDDLHKNVDKYNYYVVKINSLLTGRFSGILFKMLNVSKAGPIEV